MIARRGKSFVAISHHSSMSSPFDEIRATFSILLYLSLKERLRLRKKAKI